MKNPIKEIITTSAQKLIKVQLDYRTCIYIKNIATLQVWLPKYPNATIITY
ncbi:MAG TPA: hypothetical protein VK808_05570 [Bacteroidia bacterium]|nr:hypothetical protein [Bacteroidia bacterium]